MPRTPKEVLKMTSNHSNNLFDIANAVVELLTDENLAELEGELFFNKLLIEITILERITQAAESEIEPYNVKLKFSQQDAVTTRNKLDQLKKISDGKNDSFKKSLEKLSAKLDEQTSCFAKIVPTNLFSTLLPPLHATQTALEQLTIAIEERYTLRNKAVADIAANFAQVASQNRNARLIAIELKTLNSQWERNKKNIENLYMREGIDRDQKKAEYEKIKQDLEKVFAERGIKPGDTTMASATASAAAPAVNPDSTPAVAAKNTEIRKKLYPELRNKFIALADFRNAAIKYIQECKEIDQHLKAIQISQQEFRNELNDLIKNAAILVVDPFKVQQLRSITKELLELQAAEKIEALIKENSNYLAREDSLQKAKPRADQKVAAPLAPQPSPVQTAIPLTDRTYDDAFFKPPPNPLTAIPQSKDNNTEKSQDKNTCVIA